jgi:trehalose-phosphatase
MNGPIEYVEQLAEGQIPPASDLPPKSALARRRRAIRRPAVISASRAWPEIRERLHSSDSVALFLDFDGTLVGLRPRPEQVGLPQEVRRLLSRLSRRQRLTIVIASGRRVRDLKRLIGLRRLRYFGVHGAENEGAPLTISKNTRAALREAHRAVTEEVAQMSGVRIEPKGVAFAIHYRGAKTVVARRLQRTLARVIDQSLLRILKGKRVWEVLPQEVVGKSAIVRQIVGQLPGRPAVIYIGDDETDEEAFSAIPDGITVVVGNRPGTRARYSLPSPAAVFRFLTRLHKELR